MKTLILTMLISSVTTLLFSSELTWVDKQIEAIKPPRTGLTKKEISLLKDPFILLVEEQQDKKDIKSKKSVKSKYNYKKKIRKKRSYHFKLQAIMNKSVLINGKWYKEGDSIYGYKIAKVNRKSVLLLKGTKKLKLTTVSQTKNLKFNEK